MTVDSSPALSVIIPCYNAGHTISETLEGLADQVWHKPFEVIVADNGSSDNTEDVVQSYADRFAGFSFIHANKVRGPGHGRNQGVLVAKADYLAFMDADDVPDQGWVAAIGDALDEHPFVASRHLGNKLNSAEQLQVRRVPQSEGLQEYTEPPFLAHSGGCGLGIRRSAHEMVGGFDETWTELQDTEYCWRLQIAGVPLHFAGDARVHIRLRSNSKSAYLQAFRWACLNVRLYKEFRPRGMPKLPLRRGINWWLYHLGPKYMVSQLKDPVTRPRWFWLISWRFGRLVGSIRYLTWAL